MTRTAVRMGVIALFAAVVSTALHWPAQPAKASGAPTFIQVELAANRTAVSHVFSINGHVTELYPGRTAPLLLTVSNPNASSIQVNSLTVTAGASNKSGCEGTSALNLQTSNYSGPAFIVPAHGNASVSLSITMPGTVANACQGATFSLTYGGSATQVVSP
jgi:hypothetical protein